MRVFLVDSQPIVRERLKSIIGTDRDLTVVGEAATCRDMARPAADIDLLILDEELDSLQLLNSLRRTRPEGQRPFVLVSTKHTGKRHAGEMLKAGADGCLGKSDLPATVLNAIHKIANGCKSIPKNVAETNILARTERSRHRSLSLREYQVLCLLASGMSMSGIAGYLSLSLKTIGAYRASLLEKLNCRSNVQLIRGAIKKGMVT